MTNALIWFLVTFYIHLSVGVVPIEDLFPFGIDVGDSVLPPMVGSAIGPITLRQPFPFFNYNESQLLINSNGAISFRYIALDVHPQCGPDPYGFGLGMIVPYWAHVQTNQGLGGSIYYRESNDQNLRTKAVKEIEHAFPDMRDLQIEQLLITTWSDVTFEGARDCNHNNLTAPRNTFQMILASDGVRSFAFFYYAKITWTACIGWGGGNCSGLAGSHPAKAGVDFGDGKSFFEIPGSCANVIYNISDSSNIGIPGKWAFRVDTPEAPTTASTEATTATSTAAPTEATTAAPTESSADGRSQSTVSSGCGYVPVSFVMVVASFLAKQVL